MLKTLFVILISYIIGSIPTAYLFGRAIKGVDIRNFGSGNVGATNALRLLGKRWGITVLILDILKGLIPVIALGIIFKNRINLSAEALYIITGISCICGHNWTIFLGFKGGKGVATTLGVLLGLSIQIPGLRIILGLTVAVWFLTFIISRIISLASILSALSFPVFTIIFKQSPLLIFIGIFLSFFIILRHKANLQRILKGEEPQLNFKKH
jgi:glycerol-3-phosphate acyltransferase PlsY